MGWFNKQIEERQQSDQQLLEDSFQKIAGVVLGERVAQRISDKRIVTQNAIDEILKYYHFKPVAVPDEVQSTAEQVDYCLRPHAIMRRDVELTDGWYKDAWGPILAFTKETKQPVAILPGAVSGYVFTDPATGRKQKMNAKTAGLFERDAICFYLPLPQKKLGIPDLLFYMRKCLGPTDRFMIILAAVAVTLISMIMPRLTKALTGPVLSSKSTSGLIGIAICMLCVSLSSLLLGVVRDFLQNRLIAKTSLGVQASMMMRLMSLPAEFFRNYSPGELRSRSASVGSLCSMLNSIFVGAGLTSLTSLLYITQIFRFTPILVIPSIIAVSITVLVSVLTTIAQIRITRQKMEIDAKESGMTYSIINGIQKIKLAGAEKRIFAKWLDLYADGAALEYNPPLFLKINTVITLAINLFSNIVLYFLAIQSGIGQSSYFAFTAAYGMLMGAFMSVSGIALSAAKIKPILELAEPFLKMEPETVANREIVTQIHGAVELDHVSFRYEEQSPYIINDLSLKIRPGEYVAVVGRTGCGKSTLVRLLLGFEKPERGTIFYDGRSLESLDLPSLRRKIGTVMQDAGLFQGDIYSNIVITAPELSLEEAWEAAELAGIAEDIRRMPMGMHTFVLEGGGGMSGGQRQRLMIARAIAPKPNLLIFDEATSALDNKTQRQVSEALDGMGCTRLIIAHRLSTIRHCDRILVLDGGRIIEDGTYEELIEKKGFFAELVERQRLDTAS